MDVTQAYVLSRASAHGGRILDFGCGAGEVVRAGLDQGLDIWGAENFSSGDRDGLREQQLLGERLAFTKDDKLPFPDQYFDQIVSNQVFEHVARPREVLREMARVLRPGGRMLHLFPTKGTVREGHFGVPLAHHLAGTRIAPTYLSLGHRIGLGIHRAGNTRDEWVDAAHQFLRDDCFYRSLSELRAMFAEAGFTFTDNESDYIAFRATGRSAEIARRLRRVAEPAFRALAFRVVESRRIA